MFCFACLYCITSPSVKTCFTHIFISFSEGHQIAVFHTAIKGRLCHWHKCPKKWRNLADEGNSVQAMSVNMEAIISQLVTRVRVPTADISNYTTQKLTVEHELDCKSIVFYRPQILSSARQCMHTHTLQICCKLNIANELPYDVSMASTDHLLSSWPPGADSHGSFNCQMLK